MPAPRAERPLALTVYGATGFTGRLAAEYVQTQYGTTNLAWAIAGRSRAKLEALKAELAGPDAAYPSIVVADGDDAGALDVLAAQTKAVATCAGPFSRYGSKLVAACAARGTDYCDITGETDWVRAMITEHDDTARASGARLVHCCGHDSVPWDLCALKLTQALRAQGDAELRSLEFFDEIDGRPSGGTLETAFGIILGKDSTSFSKSLGYDPLLKTPPPSSEASSAKSKFALKARNVLVVDRTGADLAGSVGQHRSETTLAARTFFVMAGVNANVVKRSNALLGYGASVSYREGLACASSLRALASFSGLAVLGLLLALPPTRFLLRRFALPKPGEGPTRDQMDKGYLHVTGVATGASGKTAACRMSFYRDAGYLDTARMVVEAALTLSLSAPADFDGARAPAGGSHTPASCQGSALLKRLCDTGSTFEMLPAGP